MINLFHPNELEVSRIVFGMIPKLPMGDYEFALGMTARKPIASRRSWELTATSGTMDMVTASAVVRQLHSTLTNVGRLAEIEPAVEQFDDSGWVVYLRIR